MRHAIGIVMIFAMVGGLRAAEPVLPVGLGGGATDAADETTDDAPSKAPALPPGLSDGGNDTSAAEPPPPIANSAVGFEKPSWLYGFVDTRIGTRLKDDPNHDPLSLGELRLQLNAEPRWQNFGLSLRLDILHDDVQPDPAAVDLARGTGRIDLRAANLQTSPLDNLDLKVGRQILTWGTGDLLFINDNFPKDWRSFFAGRDVEYLKAPADALRAALFLPAFNLDVVYTPQFDPDRFIDGTRNSFYAVDFGSVGGEDATRDLTPNEWFEDDEIAMRLYRNLQAYELALYAYSGFWKSPGGQDASGRATFPPLNVFGGSVRGPFAKGIGSLEIGYLDSRDDRDGTDPSVKNSELRLLIGYERDLADLSSDLSMGVQYYLEHMLDHDAYRRALPASMPERDKNRHLITLRLTKLAMRQNLELSLFAYLSPSDEDAYLRPRAAYKLTDAWRVEAGANLFLGTEPQTFFGQFETATNAYTALRYNF